MPEVSRRWVLRKADPGCVEVMKAETGLPEPVVRVLVNRGVQDPAAAERFLAPTLRGLHPPEGLADMGRAVERLLEALRKGDRILVYGDYDVDGVTSVALLTEFLRSVGAKVLHLIPHRQKDGYGLSVPLLEEARRGGASLVLTADCGVTDTEVVERIGRMGMDVIITDHHEVPDRLPPAHAVVNPKRPDNYYPFRDLAGVGVAFLLIWSLARRLKEEGHWPSGKEPSLKPYLDLVALGTVADQVPLLGENRTLVKHGLEILGRSPRPGIRSLLRVCGSEGRPLTVGLVTYQLAPRINAPGRMESAEPALDLLLTSDEGKAEALAQELDVLNRKRQKLEEEIFREACALAEEEIRAGAEALVLSSKDWHLGVVGIVASRLVERYGRPAVLVVEKDGVGKGSARGPEGFHLIHHLRRCQDHLLRCGGHALAAGLTVDLLEIPAFKRAFCEGTKGILEGALEGPVLRLDGRLSPEEIDEELVRHLSRLEPHGVGNPEPVFQVDCLEIAQCRRVGGDHLKLWVRGGGTGFDAIGFGLGGFHAEVLGGRARLACIPQIDRWQGKTRIQLKIRDLQLLEDMTPA
jgi:single-stranded-DNA-specific exonuclease